MKIALAQIKSQKGNVDANKLHHLQVLEQASGARADLVIFPFNADWKGRIKAFRNLLACIR